MAHVCFDQISAAHTISQRSHSGTPFRCYEFWYSKYPNSTWKAWGFVNENQDRKDIRDPHVTEADYKEVTDFSELKEAAKARWNANLEWYRSRPYYKDNHILEQWMGIDKN